MSLPHAILGFLQVMPLTGYDLKTLAFDHTVAYFWPAVQQQIYRELDKMLALGWVKDERIVQHDKPNRRVYAITEAGRAELASWLRVFQPPPTYRDAFLIQLFFAAQLTNDEIAALLEDQLKAHRQFLADLEQIERMLTDEPTDSGAPVPLAPRDQALMRLTLDFGLRLRRTYIDWLTDAIKTVRGLTD